MATLDHRFDRGGNRGRRQPCYNCTPDSGGEEEGEFCNVSGVSCSFSVSSHPFYAWLHAIESQIMLTVAHAPGDDANCPIPASNQ